MPKKYLQDKTAKDFLSYLQSLGIGQKSIKFYKSDLGHFINWIIFRICSLGIFVDEFSQTIPFLKREFSSDYKKFLLENPLSMKTINRRLATIRHLGRFLLSSQTLNFDFSDNLTNIPQFTHKIPITDSLLENFRQSLEAEKIAKNTIKNYLSDIRQFLLWSKQCSR
jgi:site-specific recombinase XerD